MNVKENKMTDKCKHVDYFIDKKNKHAVAKEEYEEYVQYVGFRGIVEYILDDKVGYVEHVFNKNDKNFHERCAYVESTLKSFKKPKKV